MKRLFLLMVLAALGCGSTAAAVLTTAQAALVGFSLHANASFDGELAVNSTYIAVDAQVDASLTYRAPTVVGGQPVVVWSKSIARDSGQRAYRVVFSGSRGEDFIQIFEVSWAEARVTMPFLSPPRDSGPDVATAVSERIRVVSPDP